MSTRLDVRAPERETPDPVPAVVLPSPLHTALAGAVGVSGGIGSVVGLTHMHAPHLVGMLVLAVLLTLALAGPQLLTTARTEAARVVAVALAALAFGGAIGGLVVSFGL